MNYWDKRAIERLTEAERLSKPHIDNVKKIYNRGYRNIKRSIANIYKNYSFETGVDVQTLMTLLSKKETDKFWQTLEGKGLKQYVKNNYKARISRLEQLQAQLYAKCKELAPDEVKENTKVYRGVVNHSYNKAIYDTQIGTGYDFAFNKLDEHTINAVINERWSSKNYSQRIWANTDLLGQKIGEILGGALISGQSRSKTIRDIKDAFDVSTYYAERLIRTETNYFNNTAEALAYNEMGLERYVFVATLDSRTSEKCQEHDNKIYNFKDKQIGVNYPPLHPNCRSTIRAYIGDEEEKTIKRRAINLETGKAETINNISYKDWIKQHQEVEPVTDIIEEPLKKEVKSGIINNKNYNCELAEKLGKDHYNNIHNFVTNCKDEKVAQLWKKYESDIKVANGNYRGHEQCSGHSIYVNAENNSVGNSYEKPYQVIFHECGHAIDNLASHHKFVENSKVPFSHFSSKYKDGLFPQTIIDEVNELVNNIELKLKKEFKEHANDLKWFVDNDFVGQWRYDNYINGHSELKDLIPKYRKAYAYEYLAREIKKIDKLARGNLSDMIEGATNGRIRTGIGHGKSYWTKRTLFGVSDGLATETFAEMTDATFTNIEALEVIKKYLPKSYNLYLEMIDIILS